MKNIVVLLAICFAAIPAFPQAFTANLTGLVLDPNQAAAPMQRSS